MWLGLFIFLSYQIFDIIAEGALNPTELCQLLHLCNNTGSPDYFDFTKLLKHSWDNHKLSNTDGSVAANEIRRRTQAEVGERVKVPSRSSVDGGGREGNKLTFVHLSDIHLDRQYSEV